MVFVLHVPIVIPCLLEGMVTYFNKVYSLKEHKEQNLIFSIVSGIYQQGIISNFDVWYKKLNFLTEFSSSIFIKFYKVLALNLLSKKIRLQGFFYFMLFICPPNVKRSNFIRDSAP